MARLGPRLINCLQYGISLIVLLIPLVPMAQDSRQAEIESFYHAWLQAITQNDAERARQLALADPDTADRVATAIGTEARAAYQAGEKDRALVLGSAAVMLFDQIGDTLGFAAASNDLGVFYYAKDDCDSALPNFIRATELFGKLGQEDSKNTAAQGTELCVTEMAIPDPTLSANANLKVSPEGKQAIVFNREACMQGGAHVCVFYLVHEYAHIFLNHATNHVPPERSEPEADCWAARHVSRECVTAAHAWFMGGAPSPAVHVSSELRADRIKACAGF